MMNLHIPILLVAIIWIGTWVITRCYWGGEKKMSEDEERAYLKESMRKLDEKQSGGEPPKLYPKHPQMPGSVMGEINMLKAEIKRLRDDMPIVCIYCGETLSPESGLPDSGVAVARAREHVENCPKHPYVQIKAERDKLTKTIQEEIRWHESVASGWESAQSFNGKTLAAEHRSRAAVLRAALEDKE